ncbi:MAG: DNA polymerase III subunit delta [Tabrizicola sp.]|nr:DNA polymerase III subunit delta [Tabrizicola sp.]
MILKGLEATRYFARPDPARAGLLIFGADAMRVALRRQEVIAALIGPEGEGEMRLTRIAAGDLRKDGSLLLDAIKSVGFFPGPRVAFVEDATDTLSESIAIALQDWTPGDAQIVVAAGGLTGKSPLKSLFDKHPTAVSIGLYDDPPSREEIEDSLRKAGLARIDREAMSDLATLGRMLDPGDFRQTLDKIALFKFGDDTPLLPSEVAALAPATIEAEVDELINAVAEGRAGEIGLLIRRIEGQGVAPVTICIGAMRHFRILHAAASDPGGAGAGIQKARVNFKQKDAMGRQAGHWGMRTLETALAQLIEADLTLRSSSRAPAMAVMERALIRIAMSRR